MISLEAVMEGTGKRYKIDHIKLNGVVLTSLTIGWGTNEWKVLKNKKYVDGWYMSLKSQRPISSLIFGAPVPIELELNRIRMSGTAFVTGSEGWKMAYNLEGIGSLVMHDVDCILNRRRYVPK